MHKKKQESKYRKVLVNFINKYGRDHDYDFKVIRFEDLFTKGIPDMVVVCLGYSFWIEAKDGSFDVEDNQVQKVTMESLSIASLNRAWYVLLYPDGVQFFHPYHGIMGPVMSYLVAAEQIFLACDPAASGSEKLLIYKD